MHFSFLQEFPSCRFLATSHWWFQVCTSTEAPTPWRWAPPSRTSRSPAAASSSSTVSSKRDYFYRATRIKLADFSANFGDLSLKARITLPELQVSTGYDVNGRLLVVPLAGKGVLEGTFSECSRRNEMHVNFILLCLCCRGCDRRLVRHRKNDGEEEQKVPADRHLQLQH